MSLKDWGNSKIDFGYYDKTVGVSDTEGVFVFAAASDITPENQMENRCDIGSYGPVCVNWTGVDPYRLPPFIKQLSNLKYLNPIIDCAPDFYILYYEAQETEHEVLLRNYDILPEWQKQAIDAGWKSSDKKLPSPELENIAITAPPHVGARTLGELFKLILEWNEVTNEPFNNEERVALVAKKILEKLDMPEDVKEELWSTFPDSHVVRYIEGDPDARERSVGVPNITPLFDAWIETKMIDYPYRGPMVAR
jgi:hypothetical protein